MSLRDSSGLALAAGGDTHWCIWRHHYELALCSSHPTWWDAPGWSAGSPSRLGWCTQPANTSKTPIWKDWQKPCRLSNDLHLSARLKQWQSKNMKRGSWDTEKVHGLEAWKHSTANPWLYSSKVLRMVTVKGKAIPLQPWTGPEGSRKLRHPDFKTNGTWRW